MLGRRGVLGGSAYTTLAAPILRARPPELPRRRAGTASVFLVDATALLAECLRCAQFYARDDDGVVHRELGPSGVDVAAENRLPQCVTAHRGSHAYAVHAPN